jgi:UDP-N-acetylmuramoylalanine--D-glutamate ligase
MINHILEKSGYKVLMGGNAGGGFEGYTRLILEASKNNYDYLIVEVCDMTLDFCAYNFDFNLIVVTNLGFDHINVHKTMTQYQNSMREFIRNKTAMLNLNDPISSTLPDDPSKSHFFNIYTGKLDLIGKFNRQNAAAAAKVAEILSIPEKTVKESLSSFKNIEGRITEFKLNGSKLVIGKTDNVSAITPILDEFKFDLIILGTPRKKEYWRFDIFREVADSNPEYIGLFPGLENTIISAREELRKNGFNGEIKIFNNVNEVVEFILNHYQIYKTIFIGGNGQDKISEIKKSLPDNLKNK